MTAGLTAFVITDGAICGLTNVGSRSWSIVHSRDGNVEVRLAATRRVGVTRAPVIDLHDECCAAVLELVALFASSVALQHGVTGGSMRKDSPVAHAERFVVVRVGKSSRFAKWLVAVPVTSSTGISSWTTTSLAHAVCTGVT